MPCLDYASLTRDEGDGFAFELCHLLPVGIADGEPGMPKKKDFSERAWFNGFRKD